MTAPLRSRLTSTWALLLAGPVLGTAYFFVVYLAAEAACADDLDLVSTTALRIVILTAAAATVGVFVAYALRGRRLWTDAEADAAGVREAQNQRFMITTGLLLLGLFVLFVLFLAAPAIGSTLC